MLLPPVTGDKRIAIPHFIISYASILPADIIRASSAMGVLRSFNGSWRLPGLPQPHELLGRTDPGIYPLAA